MGNGPALRWQLGKVAGQTENGAVLMQQRVVFRPGDAAAAGGEDDAGALALFRQNLCFQFPECFLPGLGEDLRDGHPSPLGDQFVSLHYLPVQRFAQSGGHGGFAAAGHSDEDDIPQPLVHSAFHPRQGFIADGRAGELLAGALGLSHQHGKSPSVGNPQLFCL